MNNRYRIRDWAGNDKTAYYGQFHSFEDAWDALYWEFRDLSDTEFDTQINEFYVEETDI